MAMTVSRLGVGRLGNFRLGYYQPWYKVYINGVNRSGGVSPADARTLTPSVQVVQILNHEVDTATLRVYGFIPEEGQEIQIYRGAIQASHLEFAGHIIRVTDTVVDEHIFYDLDCVDYTWQFGQLKVTKRYTNASATDIIEDLVATFAPDFTATNVDAGLETLDEITFTNEDLPDALTRIMERAGGYWFVDYSRDVHAFTAAAPAGAITDASMRTARNLRKSTDLSQVATRIVARGGGAVTLSDCAVGQATMPIEDPSWYSASGGIVQVGPQNVTYTGVAQGGTGSTTGYVNPPNTAGTVTANSIVVGGPYLSTGTYRVALTYVTAEGETTPSAYQSITLVGAEDSIVVNSIPVPTDPKVTSKKLYCTTAGGVQLKVHQTVALATTTANITSVPVGANAPTVNTAGFSQEATAAGATSLAVSDLAQFPAAGWAEGPGGQVFYYSGRSATSGAGSLTGIPASGIGAISAEMRAGTIYAVPHLTGIPASGDGSIEHEVKRGDQAYVLVIRDDVPAQAALAALVGGDGVREYFFSDGRLSLTELTARADALLEERKDPLITISMESRDPTIEPGRTIAFSTTTPAISGTFLVQRVTVSELAFGGTRVWPKRQVELSSKRYSFEDLIRQIKLIGRPS